MKLSSSVALSLSAVFAFGCQPPQLQLECPAEAVGVGSPFAVTARMSPAEPLDCNGTWVFEVSDQEAARLNVVGIDSGSDDDASLTSTDQSGQSWTVSHEGDACVARAELRTEDAGERLVRVRHLREDNSASCAVVADGAIAGESCRYTTFSFAGAAQAVLVSGTFTGWAETEAAGALPLIEESEGVWTLTTFLDAGVHEYKLIVDGEWILDPNASEQVDDTVGGFNSLVEVCPPAPEGLQVASLDVDEASGLVRAVLTGDALDATQLAVTLDWQPVSSEVVDGQLVVERTVTPGIHDLRVEDAAGEITLVKIHNGVSHDWRDAPIYFAMTDRFANGDESNDAPLADVPFETNFQGGDFAGIQERIEAGYFEDLGVGALWITWPAAQPVGFEEGGRATEFRCGAGPDDLARTGVRYAGYHGYWPRSLDEVDPHFGDMQSLQDMVNAAHARGLRVMLDFAANHLHDTARLFEEREADGWFNTPARTCTEVNWDPAETCWFDDFLPDLNYQNEDVRQTMTDAAVWWVEQTGADGFRFDAVKHMDMPFIEDLRARTRTELELGGNTFYILGETFSGDAGEVMSYVSRDRLHGQFDFPSNIAILEGFAQRTLPLDQMDARVRGAKGLYGHETLMSTFLGNHDIGRFISLANGDLCGPWQGVSNTARGWVDPPQAPQNVDAYERLRVAFTYVMTTPGVPLIYYGDEVGLPGAGDPDNRRFMRFDDELSGNEAELLSFMKNLMVARRDSSALRRGTWSIPIWNDGELLAYARIDGESRALVVLNRSDVERTERIDVGQLGFPDGALTERLWGGQFDVAGGEVAITLGPRSAFVMTN